MLKQKLDIRDVCLKNIKVAEIFLKKALENDLNLY